MAFLLQRVVAQHIRMCTQALFVVRSRQRAMPSRSTQRPVARRRIAGRVSACRLYSLTAYRCHRMYRDSLLEGKLRHQPWNWFCAAACTQRVGRGAYGQPICRTRSGRALFLSPRDRDMMNMGGAAGMTAEHTMRTCHQTATLDMAAPIIWSRYHRRLPLTSGEVTDIAG